MSSKREVKVLFYSGTGFIGTAIRWRTWGQYSHVAIQIGRYVYEAIEGKGVIKTLAFKHRANRKPALVKSMDVTWEEYADMVGWLEMQVGKPYDYWAILGFLTRRQHADDSKWFCSELVYDAFVSVDIYLLDNTPSWKVSPSLLARSTVIKDI